MSRSKSYLTLCQAAFITIAILLSVCSSLAQRPLMTLHRFQAGDDGGNPAAPLIQDKAGNFYGTTEYYGAGCCYGTVFELSPPANSGGGWTETVLYAFLNDGDGARPTAGVIIDGAGNLYGTASGSNSGEYGVVFELAPTANGGSWTETVLYSFKGGSDGAYPYGGLVSDPQGNLYGTTETSVFELSPPAANGGAWTFTLLHDFVCCTSDGWSSVAGLVRDSQGNLYGTTEWGGSYTGEYCGGDGCGTVFEVSPVQGGSWSETVLYRFGGEPDGLNPVNGLALDAHGNLYGSTFSGGALGGGTAFELSPPAQQGGPWTKTIIHNFTYGNKHDGAVPMGTFIFDSVGNLYGATELGGNTCDYGYGCGTVFELTPPNANGGAWTETLLHTFSSEGPWPRQPGAGLIFDNRGDLLGTTLYGGNLSCACGTIFEIR